MNIQGKILIFPKINEEGRVRDVKKVHGVYLVVRVVLNFYLQVFQKLEGELSHRLCASMQTNIEINSNNLT